MLKQQSRQPRSVKVSAPAKINLALRVGAKREDGFHPLDTVFEALDIFDDVEAIRTDTSEVSMEIHGKGEDLPADAQNLVIRAAQLLQDKHRTTAGAHLIVTKRIPVAAGMAGGSADAAATLLALNNLWELGLSDEKLAEYGAELGSDVPFALTGGIARGISRGECLKPVQAKQLHAWVILINPKGLSTPQVFTQFDQMYPQSSPVPKNTQPLLDALANGSLKDLAKNLVNDLYPPAIALRPDLAEIFEKLADIGQGRIMSGSGPTMAVLCEIEQLQETAAALTKRFPELQVTTAIGPAAGAHLR